MTSNRTTFNGFPPQVRAVINASSTKTFLGLAGCLMVLAGCQSTNYRAATLPADLRVPASVGTRQLQLEGMASAAARSTAISPGDILEVRVISGVEEKAPEPLVLQVSTEGRIDLPLVGAVGVAGLDPPEASATLAQTAVERGIYRQPNVTVEVKKRATRQVTVLGAVEEPGVHELPVGNCNLLAAIAAAGGVTEEADTHCEVMRRTAPTLLASKTRDEIQQVAYSVRSDEGSRVERIDLAMASGAEASQSKSHQLSDRDVVLVPPSEKRVIHVTGLVKTPDQFELPSDQDLRVLDAIAMAGGRSSPVADKVYVIRQRETGSHEPAVIQVSVAKAKHDGLENLILGPGDLVSVESTVATTVSDAIRDFFRISVGVSSTLFTP